MGVPPDQMDRADYSLDDLAILTEGHRLRWASQYELGLWIAWHVAAFSRCKKLPSWDSIRQKQTDAKPGQPPRKMTEAEMINAMMAHTQRIVAQQEAPRRIIRRTIE